MKSGLGVDQPGKPILGKLKVVDAREIWKNEAHHFTPWLRENIALLAAALGIEIEIEASELAVGEFAADLHGREVRSDRPVVIENQLEQTDHSHLGQILTYAAGLDVAIIVWIAARFRDEHRQALDWLNLHTDKAVDFFGVEIELVRIDDSPPAPHFKIVSQPNEWTKIAKALGVGSGEPTERQLKYKDFFEQVLAGFKQKRPLVTAASRVGPVNWFGFAAGRAGFGFNWSFANEGRFRTELYIDTNDPAVNKRIFDKLREKERELQSKLKNQVEWERLENRRASRIAVYRKGTIDLPEHELAELRSWAVDAMVEFVDALKPMIISVADA